jgi:DNA-binding beta-propeller fold protein YncE
MRATSRTAAALFAFAALLPTSAAFAADPSYTVRLLPLPGAMAKANTMDYIAFDPATKRVWVPAGSAGAVVVIETSSGELKPIADLPTAEVGSGDRKRKVGPSSATVGDGVVYVGNRADSSICAFDAKTLAKGACRKLDQMPDGLAYVASTKEVWATTPRDKSIRVLDASTLAEKTKVTVDGGPEGFAVDNKRGRFYTNLEDKDQTLAIDLKDKKVLSTWKTGCGEDGPRGLRVDADSGHLFVACTAKVEVLDAAKDGAVLSSLETGEGVDDLDWAAASHLLYVGAGKAALLTVASVDAAGKLTLVEKVPTHAGARNPAVTDKGVVYLAHGGGGLLDVVVATPKK